MILPCTAESSYSGSPALQHTYSSFNPAPGYQGRQEGEVGREGRICLLSCRAGITLDLPLHLDQQGKQQKGKMGRQSVGKLWGWAKGEEHAFYSSAFHLPSPTPTLCLLFSLLLIPIPSTLLTPSLSHPPPHLHCHSFSATVMSGDLR